MKKILFWAVAILMLLFQSNADARGPGGPGGQGGPGCPGWSGPGGGPHHDGDPGPPRRHHEKMFDYLDVDGDGKLSRGEAEAGPPHLADRFDELDEDGDGFISIDEFGPPGPPFRRRGPGMGGNHFAMQLFMTADADKDGMLSKDEFAKAFPLMADKFEEYDLDGDGYVTLEELHRPPPGLRHREVDPKREQRFKDVDEDKYGPLSKDEFSKAFPDLADKFDVLDVNRNGLIDREELNGLLRHVRDLEPGRW